MIIIQIVITLSLMIGYFVLFYNIGISLARIIGRRVCITCYSVSLTWVTLLILKYLGLFEISNHIIAILIAQSAVGISTLSDEFILINNVRMSPAILKFGTILYGTLVVLLYSFISELFGLILVIPLILLGILSMNPVNTSPTPMTNKSKKLLEKLKNCCG